MKVGASRATVTLNSYIKVRKFFYFLTLCIYYNKILKESQVLYFLNIKYRIKHNKPANPIIIMLAGTSSPVWNIPYKGV